MGSAAGKFLLSNREPSTPGLFGLSGHPGLQSMIPGLWALEKDGVDVESSGELCSIPAPLPTPLPGCWLLNSFLGAW